MRLMVTKLNNNYFDNFEIEVNCVKEDMRERIECISYMFNKKLQWVDSIEELIVKQRFNMMYSKEVK